MKKLIFLVLSLICMAFTTACDTQVTAPATEEEAANEKSENAPSSLELLENNSAKSIESCTPQNSVKFILTQNSKDRVFCRENTQLDPNLTAGPVCSGGVKLVAFSSKTSWVDCSELVVCGQKAKNVQELSSGSSVQMRQIAFSNLPWGCTGEIEVATESEKSDASLLRKIAVNVKAPICPMCDVSNTRTCAICGSDTTAPEILDVFTESSQCNRIRVLVFAEDANAGIHAQGYSFDGGLTWQAESHKDFTGLDLSLDVQKIWVRDRAGNIAKYTKAVAATASPCPCDTPWGERIEHGQTRTGYKSPTVACTTTCAANSQARTCNNGVLSGTGEFSAKSCQVTGCPKCKLPWGEEIDHGIKVKAYKVGSAPCAGECSQTELSCEQGVLKGTADTHRFKSCNFERASCDCKHLGLIIPNGQKKKVFATAEVNCGSSCTEGEVSCVSGEIKGNTTYQNVSCSPKICKCVTSWGQQLDPNETTKAYKDSTITCEDKMICDDPSNKIEIKCADVITNKFDIVQGTGPISNFKQPSCVATTCGCVHLGTVFKPTDPALAVYKKDKATSPDKCELAGIKGEVRCKMSGTKYVVEGDTDTNTYKYTQCENVTGNTSPYVVGPGDGGGANGGVGNDEGEGEGFRRRTKGGGGGGGGCDINKPPYYCWSSGGSVYHGVSFCFAPTEIGYPERTDAKDLSQRISPGSFMAAFSKTEVACGDSCSNYMGIISCDHGVMSGKNKYKYLNCREVCP